MDPKTILEWLDTPGITPAMMQERVEKGLTDYYNQLASQPDSQSPNQRATTTFNLHLAHLVATKTIWAWKTAHPDNAIWSRWNEREAARSVQITLGAIFAELDPSQRDYTFHPGYQFLAGKPGPLSRNRAEQGNRWPGNLAWAQLRHWLNETVIPASGQSKEAFHESYLNSAQKRLLEAIAEHTGGTLEKDGRVVNADGQEIFVDSHAPDQAIVPQQRQTSEPEAEPERLSAPNEYEFWMGLQLGTILSNGLSNLAHAASHDPIGAWAENRKPALRRILGEYYDYEPNNTNTQYPLTKTLLVSRLFETHKGQQAADFIIRGHIISQCGDGTVAEEIRGDLRNLQNGPRKVLPLWEKTLFHLAATQVPLHENAAKDLIQKDTVPPAELPRIETLIDWIEEQGYVLHKAANSAMTVDQLQEQHPGAYRVFRFLEQRYTATREQLLATLKEFGLQNDLRYSIQERNPIKTAYRIMKAECGRRIIDHLLNNTEWAVEAKTLANNLLDEARKLKTKRLEKKDTAALQEQHKAKVQQCRQWLYQRTSEALSEQLDNLLARNRLAEIKQYNRRIINETNDILQGKSGHNVLYHGPTFNYTDASYRRALHDLKTSNPEIGAKLPAQITDEKEWEAQRATLDANAQKIMGPPPPERGLPQQLEAEMQQLFWKGLGERFAHENPKQFVEFIQDQIDGKDFRLQSEKEAEDTEIVTYRPDGEYNINYAEAGRRLAMNIHHQYLASTLNATLKMTHRLLQNPELKRELNPYRRTLKAENRDSLLTYRISQEPGESLRLTITRQTGNSNQAQYHKRTYENGTWKRLQQRQPPVQQREEVSLTR